MNNNWGVGFMIGMLSGNEDSVNAIRGSLNKKIKALSIEDDALLFSFDDKTKLKIADDGQSCCESRYMRTDDDLSYYIGSTLLDFELANAPDEPDEWGVHEVQFLKVKTDNGTFTISNHNEHNGYYGGILVKASIVN